jgi:hypothetical protein
VYRIVLGTNDAQIRPTGHGFLVQPEQYRDTPWA